MVRYVPLDLSRTFKVCVSRLVHIDWNSSLTFYCGHYASNIEPTHEQSVSAFCVIFGYLEARPLLPPEWRQGQGWRRSQLATDGHWPLLTPAQLVLGLPDIETVAADVSVVMSLADCDRVCCLHTSLHSWWLLWPLNGHYVVNKSLIWMFYRRYFST